MKISTKGRYGLRILLDLAVHESNAPRLIRDISKSQQISEKYISRLIITLRRADMVRSIRGAKGGFRLARKPSELTLLEVIETMEGPLSIVGCVNSPEKCMRREECLTRRIWVRLNTRIRDFMGKITLADIIEEGREHEITAGNLIENDRDQDIAAAAGCCIREDGKEHDLAPKRAASGRKLLKHTEK